jgi:hypothetical protein
MISLTPNEVERRFGILGIPSRFADEEKIELGTTAVVQDPADVFVFPTPKGNGGLNILNLRRYLDEPFAQEDCDPGWHRLYQNVLPDSVSQPLDYASSLKSRGLELASAVEVTLMLFLHYAETREQLLHKKHTWCSNRASMNRWVTVGAFGRNGLFVSGHPPDFSSRGLGICAKIT